jgi:two-component system alkaline phosphatase synthesis response regulator PhoP
MKILLVDDDVFLRDMYATKFQEYGDEVDSAKDGSEALRMVSSNTYDVVITDMVMPGMSGTELVMRIKELAQEHIPKCLVLSNQSEEADIKNATDNGADGYLIKAALVPSEVVAKVHEIIS